MNESKWVNEHLPSYSLKDPQLNFVIMSCTKFCSALLEITSQTAVHVTRTTVVQLAKSNAAAIVVDTVA